MENPEHIAAGDLMQSSLSRLIEWVSLVDDPTAKSPIILPYEVRMAILEGQSAIEAWTEARRGDARGNTEQSR